MLFKELRSLFRSKKKHAAHDDEAAPSTVVAELSGDTSVNNTAVGRNGTNSTNGLTTPQPNILGHNEKSVLIRLDPQHPESAAVEATETYSLDIVAVHGITGDALKSWTHDNGKLWLRDFLPKDLPGARVFSYGYPAAVFFTRSTGDIESFARSLLERLTNERRELKVVIYALDICKPSK